MYSNYFNALNYSEKLPSFLWINQTKTKVHMTLFKICDPLFVALWLLTAMCIKYLSFLSKLLIASTTHHCDQIFKLGMYFSYFNHGSLAKKESYFPFIHVQTLSDAPLALTLVILWQLLNVYLVSNSRLLQQQYMYYAPTRRSHYYDTTTMNKRRSVILNGSLWHGNRMKVTEGTKESWLAIMLNFVEMFTQDSARLLASHE